MDKPVVAEKIILKNKSVCFEQTRFFFQTLTGGAKFGGGIPNGGGPLKNGGNCGAPKGGIPPLKEIKINRNS